MQASRVIHLTMLAPVTCTFIIEIVHALLDFTNKLK